MSSNSNSKSNSSSAGSEGVLEQPTEDWLNVMERHRHRYEVNPAKVAQLEAAGLFFTGRDDSGERMEIAEISRADHPFYFGVQFHPEFKSRPNRPSPPFFAFACAVAGLAGEIQRAGVMFQRHEARIRENILRSPMKKRPRTGSGSL